MDRITRRSRGGEGLQFDGRRISSLLFAVDVVLMASSACDLQHSLDRLAAKCEAAGIRISTAKSEAMTHSRKPVELPTPGRKLILSPTEGVQVLSTLFASEGTKEHEIGRRISAAGAVLCSLYHMVVTKRAEPEGKALDLPVDLRSYPHVWS